MKLKDFVIFNPKEKLVKNEIYRKISMDQITPFTRYIKSENFESYKGGSKFKNGDTIFARITPCLENGKTCFVNSLNNDEIAFGSTEFIIVRAKQGISLPLFVFYLFTTEKIRSKAIISMTGSSGRERVQQVALDNIEIPNYPLTFQQHIVNTIGSVDDLIENYNKKIEKLMNLGLIKINLLNSKKNKIDLSSITKFEKGNELGSSNYFDYYKDNFINYIRVGDLLSLSNTYVDKNICNKFVEEEDILIAMDGAPGRNAIGLNGSYSSGLYKMLCNKDKKGLVYFELNSDLNQNIIKNMSQGTTILHASKSIPFLKTIEIDEKENEYFNNIFNEIFILKKKVSLLKNIKDKLLIKYFTNQ